jgi:hypothetical protein
MFHHLVTCVVVVSALLAAPISASAAVVANEAAVYDTVDAIEVNGNRITIAQRAQLRRGQRRGGVAV